MSEPEVPAGLSQYFRELGARGGKARWKGKTPTERKRALKKVWSKSAKARRERKAGK